MRFLRSTTFAVVATVAAAWACSSSSACSGGARQTRRDSVAPAAPLPRPALRLVAVTDLAGYLEPCGCQSRPLGGIDKMAAQLAELRRDGIPLVFVAAGDLFFSQPESSHGVSGADTQELWKAETLSRILKELELTAFVHGPNDLMHGDEKFLELVSATGANWTSCETYAIRNVGESKVAFIGVAESRVCSSNVVTQDLVNQARAQGASHVVLLTSGSRRFARRLASSTTDVDYVIMGGLNEPEVSLPSDVGQTYVLHASHHGQGLLVVDLFDGAAGAWRDVSEWTARARREEMDARVRELEERVTTWRSDSNVSRADLAAQEARLESLKNERRQLAVSPSLEGHRGFFARFIELGPELAGDSAVAALVDAYDHRVNDHNRVAFAEVLPPPARPGEPHYIGSESCGGCHAEALAWWKTTPHGNAYATLETRNKQFNLSCVGCHVTGYGQPGGSNVTHVENLKNVGCENCHGAGSAHATNPTEPIARAVPESTCLRCHNTEHSDQFRYDVYRQMLMAPGHGLPSAN